MSEEKAMTKAPSRKMGGPMGRGMQPARKQRILKAPSERF